MVVSICSKIVDAKWFQRFIVGVILFNGAIIGMETYSTLNQSYGVLLHGMDQLCLLIFVLEIILKVVACGRRPIDFFRNGWNLFDFIIVTAALMPGIQDQATVLRLIRLLRVLRLLSALPGLQVLILALLKSIPSIGQMALLASLLFYIYAVIGTTLFGSHDPQHWGSLHISLLSLFRTLTLEDWTDLMYKGMELYPWAWIFFVSFVLLGTFIIFNMLIGVILNSMADAKEIVEREKRAMELLSLSDQIKSVRAALDDLEHLIKVQADKEKGQPK